MTTAAYQASPIRRQRATKAEMEERAEFLIDYASEHGPVTVRGLYYQAEVASLPGISKDDKDYAKVQRQVLKLRREGRLSYSDIADATRWMRKPRTHDSVEEALRDTARFYRKALWADADSYVEIWLEKDALAGVVLPITYMYDVPLMVSRGYASLSFLHSAAECINNLFLPAYIYHLGDFDPSGVNAGEKIEETLKEMAPDAEIYFERLAVTEEQISAWNLPPRPTKTTDTRSKNFGSSSVELDAIGPNTLRDIVRQAIELHLPKHQYQVLKAAEESERKLIKRLVAKVSR